MSIRATLVELWTRKIKYDKHDDIYINGKNNLYPNEMERAVQNSPTGNRSALMLSKFIAGRGIKGENPIVNLRRKYKLTDIVQFMAEDIAIQNGCFIHIGYGISSGGVPEPRQLTVLDYTKCRIGKEDDNDNFGKIWVKDYEEKKTWGRTYENEAKWYYPYNPNEDIIIDQINADTKDGTLTEKINNYRGQVFYLNLTPRFRYAISRFDGVYNDMDTEYRMSLYANTMTRGGFLGKTAVLTQGLSEDKAKEVEEDIRNWLGSEKAGHLYHLDVDQAEELDNVIKIIQVESQYDDQMFVNTDKRLRRNISGAANNIPEGLIYSSEGALFGTSGEMYREMKEFYSEQTEAERRIVERTLTKLGFPVEIIPITDEADMVKEEQTTVTEEEQDEENEENEENGGNNSSE